MNQESKVTTNRILCRLAVRYKTLLCKLLSILSSTFFRILILANIHTIRYWSTHRFTIIHFEPVLNIRNLFMLHMKIPLLKSNTSMPINYFMTPRSVISMIFSILSLNIWISSIFLPVTNCYEHKVTFKDTSKNFNIHSYVTLNSTKAKLDETIVHPLIPCP